MATVETENKSNHKRAGRRSKVKEGELRNTIIAAATRVFADNGYDGTSMSEIAEKAGVTKPLIFYYFGSKQELFLTILSQVQETTSVNFEHMIFNGAHSLAELLDMVVDISYNFSNSNDEKMRFFSNLVSFKPTKTFIQQELNHWRNIYQLLVKACSRAYDAHEIDEDPKVVASAVYSVLHFSYFKMSHLPQKLGVDVECNDKQEEGRAHIKQVLKLVLRGAQSPERLLDIE